MAQPPHSKVAAIIVDVETTGLSYEFDMLLELGMVAIDSDMNVVDTFDRIVNSPKIRYRLHEVQAAARDEGDDGAKFVIAMHAESGLAAALERGEGADIPEVVEQAADWLQRMNGVGLPMMGSNVQFDRNMLRRHMPSLEAMFHYRNIDVSSIKEWVKAFGGDTYPTHIEPQFSPRKLHRTVADCIDTRDELRIYTELFL